MIGTSRKVNGGSWNAPSNDLYGRYGKSAKKESLFASVEIDKQLILPGVTQRERETLKSIKQYVTESTGYDCTLPDHIIEDVYSLYVNEDFKRRETTGRNAVKQSIIDKVYNSLTKTVTKGSPLFSKMVTRELAVYMQKVQDELDKEKRKDKQSNGNNENDDDSEGQGKGFDQDVSPEEKPEDGNSEGKLNPEDGEDDNSDKVKGKPVPGKQAGEGTNVDGQGDLDQSKLDKINKSIDKYDNLLDKVMKTASDKMKDLEDKIGKEALKDLSESEPGFMDNIDGIKSALNKISINKASIKEVLVKILNKSENHFSKNFHSIEESLFDCEDCEDLYGLEFLNPIFKQAEMMNIVNQTRVYTGKIDLYIDCSSSMRSSRRFEGSSIRMSDLVKGIAMILYQMGMIEKLYFFDSGIYEIKKINEFSILSFDKTGGTNFNNVIDKCKISGRNSVIITDGQASAEDYVKNAFWVGIGGANFDGDYGAWKKYRDGRQCVAYQEDSSGGFKYCV